MKKNTKSKKPPLETSAGTASNLQEKKTDENTTALNTDDKTPTEERVHVPQVQNIEEIHKSKQEANQKKIDYINKNK